MATASSNSTRAEPSNGNRPARRGPRLFPAELFLLTADTRSGVVATITELEAYLGRPRPAALHDLAWTVSRSFRPELECLAVVASSHEDLRAKLARARERLVDDCRLINDRDGVYYASERLGDGKVAFLFPGENAQYPGMLRELWLSFPEIREAFDVADAACTMAGDGFLPSALNFPTPGSDEAATLDELARWEKAVTLVHTANTGMARLLEGLKVRPDAVLGHSFGELSALEMAGVLRPGEDRVRSAHHAYLHLRELSQERDLPVGRLLTVGGVEAEQIEEILGRFPDELRVAMENCPHQHVLCASGSRMDEVIAEVREWLTSEGAICSILPIRRPYHTAFFEPAFPLEKAYFEEVGVHPPRIQVYSCATTEPFPSEPEEIVEVAARHWMSCVRFQSTIEKLHDRGFRVFIDVGPRGNLCAFVSDTLKNAPHLAVALNRAQRSDIVQLLNALGVLAAHGVPISVRRLHEAWGSREVEIRAEPGKATPSMAVRLPTDIPTMRLRGVVPSPATPARPAGSAGVPAPRGEAHADPGASSFPPAAWRGETPVALPLTATGSAPGAALSPLAATETPADEGAASEDEETAAVMVSYMDTMERFLSAQGTLLSSLLNSTDPGPSGVSTESWRPGTPASPAGEPGVEEASAEHWPLLGSIQELVPGETLRARRVLDVEQDLFLKDHTLGTRISTTDPGLTALPVMPLTFSLEVAAEAGAALFPRAHVAATVDIRAYRWIFVDGGTVALQVAAKKLDVPGDEVRVHVSIKQEDGEDPRLLPTTLEVTVVLTDEPQDPPRAAAAPLPPSARCEWSRDDVYPRRTFHGPRFQGIRSVDRLSEEGLDGTLEVLPWSGLLRGISDPQLKLDPVLIDILGQAVWLWGSKEPFQGLAYLPFGAKAVRQYGPRLPPGAGLDLRLRVVARDARTVTTVLEAVDSDGLVRLLIEDLYDREFSITPALHRLMLEPVEQRFADVRTLELPVPALGTAPVFFGIVADFPHSVLEESFGVWRKALAFLILSREERDDWRALDVPLRREIHWLLGRAAAKDALRALLESRTGRHVGSADLVLRNDSGGRPVLARGWPSDTPGVPQISISHTDGMAAAAVADGVRLGVDTERVRAPSQDLLDGAFSHAELGLLPRGASDAERAEWVFRFWCAKEAVGKARSTGVGLDPRQLAVTRCERRSGEVTVRERAGGEVPVTTFRIGDHVFAVAVLAIE